MGGTFSAGNYTITYTTANLTVTTRRTHNYRSRREQSYGQTVAFGAGSGTVHLRRLCKRRDDGSVTLTVSGNGGAATALVSGSPYAITPSAAIGGTSLTLRVHRSRLPGQATVNPAVLTVTASAQNKSCWTDGFVLAPGAAFFPAVDFKKRRNHCLGDTFSQ